MRTIPVLFVLALISAALRAQLPYPIVDTDVSEFYDATSVIAEPGVGAPFYGQDAHYAGNQPTYTDHGDGTVTDQVTGLMWQQDMGVKITYAAAQIKADTMTLGGYNDWRIPTIKELYSLALFTGRCFGSDVVDKFIDTTVFLQPIGNESLGEREIDAQVWSSTHYAGLIMNGDTAIFGYNFVDGRLKGYPKYSPANGTPNIFYFRMVRGNPAYGINDFVDNGDGTITDQATGLMWQQADNGVHYDWEDALAYAEGLTLGNHSDWRLPNAKELQSIVDYTRSPGSTASPAIDPLFTCTAITDPNGSPNYGYYWSSSPLKDGPNPYTDAVYFCFGKAQGQMEMPPNSGNFSLLDVHGAGAQRNDPKTGNPSDYPDYFGPQGDVRYVFNFVRCVRTAEGTGTAIEEAGIGLEVKVFPNPAEDRLTVELATEVPALEVVLMDATGRIVRQQAGRSLRTLSLDVSGLAAGLYTLQVRSGGVAQAQRVVIR